MPVEGVNGNRPAVGRHERRAHQRLRRPVVGRDDRTNLVEETSGTSETVMGIRAAFD